MTSVPSDSFIKGTPATGGTMLRTRWPIAAPRASVATSAAGRVALPQRPQRPPPPPWPRQPPSPCRRQARQRRQHTARSLCLRRAPRCYRTGRRASEPVIALVRQRCMQVRWRRARAARRVAAPPQRRPELHFHRSGSAGYVRRAEMLWDREGFFSGELLRDVLGATTSN